MILISNYFFISKFHAMGAAIATVITYGCFSFCGYYIYRNCYKIRLEWKRIGLFFVYAILLIGTRSFFFYENFYANLIIDFIFWGLLPVMLWLTPKTLTENEKQNLKFFGKRILNIGKVNNE